MKGIKSWFTLVELLVIISILSILSAIWFLAYSWYTTQARNGKRTSDLNTIMKNIEISFLDGVSFFSMLENTWSTITTDGVNIQISWRRFWSGLINLYQAWDIKYRKLSLKKDNLLDPITNESYKLWVTKLWYRYELAATLEDKNGWDSLVMWSWKPRTSSWTRWQGLATLWNTYYLLSWTTVDSNLLKERDIVRIWSWATAWSTDYTIIGLKWNKVYFDKEITQWWDNVYLKHDETRHLIRRWWADWAISVWSWSTHTPYELD